MATPPIAINHPFSCYPYFYCSPFFVVVLFSYLPCKDLTHDDGWGSFFLCEHPANFDDLANNVDDGTINPCEDPWWERWVC